MIKFLHAADFHLDSPFAALSEEKAKERRHEQRKILEKLCDIAKERKAQFVLLPGDLLDSERAFSETSSQLLRIFTEIPAKIFIAPGNHDFYSHTSPYAHLELPENVHIFKTQQITGIPVPELDLTVWGAAFTSNSSGALLTGFRVPENSALNIMVLHGETDNPNSKYNPVSDEDIAHSGLDYLALGHKHAFSGAKKAGGTYYAYPGCPEGRGFDECGEKGFIFAQLEKGCCELEFLPVQGRRYEAAEIDISECGDILQAVKNVLPADTRRDIYRLLLKGEWDEKPDLNLLYQELRSGFFELEIRDNTVPRRSLWEQADSDSLKGLFLRGLKERYDAAESEEDRKLAVLAVRYGLAALENRDNIS